MELQPFKTEREWTADGIPVLSASVSMPQPVPLTGKPARRLHRYYQLQCRSYLRYCEKTAVELIEEYQPDMIVVSYSRLMFEDHTYRLGL